MRACAAAAIKLSVRTSGASTLRASALTVLSVAEPRINNHWFAVHDCGGARIDRHRIIPLIIPNRDRETGPMEKILGHPVPPIRAVARPRQRLRLCEMVLVEELRARNR